MSTKIYNGFETSFGDLETLLDLVRSYRKNHWERFACELRDTFVAAVFAGCEVQDAEAKRKSYRIWWEMSEKAKRSNERCPALDTDFKLTIFPYDGRLLGIVYCEHDAWIKAWFKMPGIREYAYWNNTDKPKNVTKKAWAAREKAWNHVLPGVGIPAMEGFSIDISDPYGAPVANLQELGV